MKMQPIVMRPLLPALACLLLTPAIGAGQAPGGPVLHDGVVVNPAEGTAYVMSPTGGIEAIDLASGARKWRSDAAAKPLVVAGDTLVAQASPGPGEQLVLVCLDTAGGAAKRRAQVSLPSGLKAEVTNGPTQKTLVRGLLTGPNSVVVAWAIEARPARGVALDDGVEEASGAARLDPTTGEVVALPAEATEAASAALSGLTLDQMTELRSVDGQHVLRSAPSPDSGNLRAPYRWTITTAAGESLGVVDAPVGLAPFVVVGSQLFHVAPQSGYRDGDRFVQEPLRLRAIDVRSGAQLWTVPVLDASFVLPPP